MGQDFTPVPFVFVERIVMVSKNQIINGLIRYVKNEVIDKITDRPLKMVLATGVSMLETNPSIADPVFKSSFISGLEKDGAYDIDGICEIIEKTMKEYGDFPITIPSIKFISPTEKELSFNTEDIRKLKKYIGGDR